MKRIIPVFLLLSFLCVRTEINAQDCINCDQINPNQPCILIYAPVCGCDGVTYANDCLAFYSGGVTSWVSGPCSQSCIDPNLIDLNAVCSTDTNYVCGCDGVTYLNECEAVNYGGITLWTTGACNFDCVNCAQIDLDVFCIALWDPVCGCNGVTYGNECEAFNWGGVTSWTAGECGTTGSVDNDGDGFDDTIDCNDMNPNIYPGAPELCNDLDDNCNNETDENLPILTYYLDGDGDDYGSSNEFIQDCGPAPDGYVNNNTDCNDNNPAIYPGAVEIPNNGVDEDCDGADLIVGIEEMLAQNFKIFPNPTSGIISIENLLPGNNPFKLEIRNSIGKKIQDLDLIKSSQTLDLQFLEAGIYNLTFTNSTFSYTSRIVIIR